jgi:hypothetical protein
VATIERQGFFKRIAKHQGLIAASAPQIVIFDAGCYQKKPAP